MKYPNLKQIHISSPIMPSLLLVPLCCFLLHTGIVLIAVMAVGDEYLLSPGGFVNPLLSAEPRVVDKFLKWDAHWYTYVAQQGYNEISIVFFFPCCYLS